MRFLIDSNIVIHYINKEIPLSGMQSLLSIFMIECNISIVTKIEVLGFKSQHEKEDEDGRIFVTNCTLFHLNDEIVAKTIEIRKQYRLKTPDAIIAATAIVNNMTLVSRNDKDFQQIKHLKYINPFRL